MALNAGAVFAEIKLKLDNFQQGLNQAKNSLSKFSSSAVSGFSVLESSFGKIQSGFSELTGIFFNLKSLLLTLGIGKLGADMLYAGIGAKRMEKTVEVMTENLGISRQEIKRWREELASANVTGINADNVLKSFMMTGLHTAVNFEELSLMVKDFSAGALDPMTGKAISSQQGLALFTNSLVKMNDEGLRQLGIELNLVSVYKKASKALNKNSSELTDQEKRMAILNEVTEIHGKTVKGLYKETYDTAGKALSSMGDAFRTLKGHIGMIFEPALASFFTLIRDNFKSANLWIKNNKEEFDAWGEKLKKYGKEAGEAINSAIERIKKDIGDWIKKNGGLEITIEKIIEKVKAFAKAIANTIKWIYEHKEAIIKAWLAWKAFQVIMAGKKIVSGLMDIVKWLTVYNKTASGIKYPNFVTGIITGSVAVAIMLIVDALGKYGDELEKLETSERRLIKTYEKTDEILNAKRDKLQEEIFLIEDKIKAIEEDGVVMENEVRIYNELNEKLGEVKFSRDELDEAIRKNIESAKEADQQLEETLDDKKFFKLKGTYKSVLEDTDNFLLNFAEKITNGITFLFGGDPAYEEGDLEKIYGIPTGERGDRLLGGVEDFFSTLKARIILKMIELSGKITEELGKLHENTIGKIIRLKDSIVEWFQTIKARVILKITEMVMKTLDKWEEFKNGVISYIANLIIGLILQANKIIGIFENLPEEIKKAMDKGMQKVLNAFGGWLGKMWKKAKEKASGIRNMISKAFDKDEHDSPSIMDVLKETTSAVNEQLNKVTIPNFHKEIIGKLDIAGQKAGTQNNINIDAQVSDGVDIQALSQRIAFNIKNSND